MFKKITILVLVFLLCLPAVGMVEENEELAPVEADKKTSSGVITVRGEGSISVEPDIGYVNFSIVESGENVIELYRDNIETADKVVEALVEYGVDRENVKTDGFSIRDDHRYLPREERERDPAYVVTTDLKVLVENLDEEMGKIIDIGIESGANRVSSIQFDVENPEEFYYDALEKALQDAKNKAERIAGFYEASLGEVKQVSEDYGRIGMGRGLEMDMAAGYGEEALIGETLPVQPDEINFESQVQVQYSLD